MLLPGDFALGLSVKLHPVKGSGERDRDRKRPRETEPAPLMLLLANPAVSQNLLPASLVGGDVSLGPVAIKGLRARRDACQGKQKDPAFCCPGKTLGDAVE